MTYKDCIHDEICVFRGKGNCPDECAQFKDKARFVELPCKIGDVVYCIRKNPYEKGIYVKENKVLTIDWNGDYFVLFTTVSEILGKTVFLTREDAERALRKRNGR